MNDTEILERIGNTKEKILNEIHKIIVGQDRVIEEILIALLSGGHILIVGVPGLAKTLIVKTLARVLSLSFSRIQFTPDLMPSDITGTEILEETASGERYFRFVKGPIFANIILADEINRTPPKTQSALLEAMQEYKVTVAGKDYDLPRPFFVLATQNPIEHEGTYPLPEAQKDRFMFQVNIYYPTENEEVKIVETTTIGYEPEVSSILTREEILRLMDIVRRMPVAPKLIEEVVRFVNLTRPSENSSVPKFIKEWVSWGASPRASQYLILGAKARALLEGRPVPSWDDVRSVALPVLRHRLILNFAAEAEGVTSDMVVEKLLNLV